MHHLKRVSIIGLLTLVSACGTVGKTEPTVETRSKADYGYIQKFHEGVRLKSKGQTEEALSVFQACHTMRPNDDAVCFALSELYLALGDKPKAGEYIVKAAKLDPGNIHYTTELAYYQYDSGQFKLAVETFKKLVDLEPRNPDFQFGLAESYVQLGKPEQAIEALNKTQTQLGVIPELSIKKYGLYMDMKKESEAINELKEAQKAFPDDPQLLGTLVDHYFKQNDEAKAIETLKAMAVADPNNGRVHLFLSEVYRQQGNRKAYYASLRKALLGEGVNLDQKMQALITLQSSSQVITQEVLELAELLQIQHPEEAKSHSIKGDFLMQMDRTDAALVAFKKALEFEKSAYPIWNQVLILEYQKGQWKDLFTDASSCLEYFPSQSVPYLLKGVAANRLERFEEGQTALETGMVYVVSDAPLKAEFQSQIAESLFGLKAFDEAQKTYEKAMKTDPNSALIPNNYAYRLASEGLELEKAKQLIEAAIEKSGRQAQFLDTYGFVLFKMAAYEEAKALFEEAYQTMKTDPILLEHLGDAHAKLNNTEKAVEFWKMAQEFGSESKSIQQKIQTQSYVD